MPRFRVKGTEVITTEWFIEADDAASAEEMVERGEWIERNVIEGELDDIWEVVKVSPDQATK
jgi:hypothetical protein